MLNRDVDDILEDTKHREIIISESKLVLEAYRPATNEEIAMVVYRVFNAYDTFKNRSEVDQTMLVEDWIDSLSIYPIYMLKEMAKRWRNNDRKGFLPTVGQFTDMLPSKYEDFILHLYSAKRVAQQDWFK